LEAGIAALEKKINAIKLRMQKLFFLCMMISPLFKTSCFSQDAGHAIDSIVLKYLDSGFSGVAMVLQQDKVVLEKGYGFADEAKKSIITSRTLFNVASIGKQFTAVTILKLEEDGLLNTKDFISKYTGSLGGLKDSATIEHLLLHTSGLFVEGMQLDYSSRSKFIESVRSTPLESRPGERHRYSNAGYTLLAAIVELATNDLFENVLYKVIFQPAGMIYTGFPWEKRINKELLATGYNRKGAEQPMAEDIWGNRGPGNVVTNTEDMIRWSKAWNNDEIISRAIKQRLLTDYIPGRETFSWNKGMTTSGKKFYSKGGGRPDFESQFLWFPQNNIFIFFSINRDKDLRRLIYREILTYIDGI
jgi:CubicO group peptidase (beta-lactamase class C family)